MLRYFYTIAILFVLSSCQIQSSSINNEELSRLILMDNEIQTRLDNYLEEVKSERVVIRRFHPGQKDFSGIPTELVSEVYISEADDFELTGSPKKFTNQPLSIFRQSTNNIWLTGKTPECYIEHLEHIEEPVIYRFLRDNDLKVIIDCPILDKSQSPLGILSLAYKEEPTAEEVKVFLAKSNLMSAEISNFFERKRVMGLHAN